MKGLRFSPGRFPWYPLRELYEQEFDAIRKKQERYYPNIAWDEIKKVIFFQRPLKKQERGKCQFMPQYERSFKVMPSAIRFRILQEVYNLVFYDEFNTPLAPTDGQRDILIQLLDASRKDVSFDTMCKKLKIHHRFNLESDIRTGLKGNETGNILRGERYFGTVWDTLPLAEQDEIVEKLIEEDEETAIIDMLVKYPLTEAQKKTIARIVPSSGTTSFCKQFTQQVVAVMEHERCGYVAALDNMGIKHSEEQIEKYDAIPYYGKALAGSTTGGDAAKYGENEPEKKYGKPAQIVIELSRDLKASKDDKEAMRKKQAEKTKRNIILNKNITEIMPKIQYPNRADRLKLRLYEELGVNGLPRCCLYCGKPIAASELFANAIEVEHILPFSRTLLDSESNLTVAHTSCNAFKMEVFEKESGFIARQLTDNAYLSKISRKYLKTVCDDVWVVSGGMTKLLRDEWNIDSILKRKIAEKEVVHFNLNSEQIGMFKKNRYDHRHHALDAMVIGLTDRAMVQNIATLCGRSQKHRIEAPDLPFTYKEIVEKTRNITVSFKPDHGAQGKLSKETALGKIKQETLLQINELTQDDIPNIKNPRIRNEFEQRLVEESNFNAVVKELRETYPEVQVFRHCFVSRTPITSLKEKISKILLMLVFKNS